MARIFDEFLLRILLPVARRAAQTPVSSLIVRVFFLDSVIAAGLWLKWQPGAAWLTCFALVFLAAFSAELYLYYLLLATARNERDRGS